jgi:hypothetical protein
VFADGERKSIRWSLEQIYPHFQEGPDEDDLESDGLAMIAPSRTIDLIMF